MDQFFNEMDQSHTAERIYPSTEWTSNAARKAPNNIKGKISAYDRKQKDMQGNNKDAANSD